MCDDFVGATLTETGGRMLYDHLPKIIKEKIADTWLKEKLLKLYLKAPHKVQYMLAKYGIKVVAHKKKQEMQEFMRH